MHPNIPSPEERWPRVAIRRAGLLLLALFVPEAVIGWALRQYQAAAKLADEHEEEDWTMAHGFFATMGGFMEYEGNRPIRVLLPEQLESYSLTGNGDFPRISKAEIEDRSKGDAISKGLVILQTSWFVTQCIARKIQGLPITELELVTVAFAALNLVIYVLWWHKPLNVERGVRVYKKRMTGEPVDDGDVETTVGYGLHLEMHFPIFQLRLFVDHLSTWTFRGYFGSSLGHSSGLRSLCLVRVTRMTWRERGFPRFILTTGSRQPRKSQSSLLSSSRWRLAAFTALDGHSHFPLP